MTHALFDPITLRGLEIRNRVWIPPMCQYMVEAQDGVPTPWHLVHLGGLARGGAGAVVVEATGVVPEGRISPQDLGLWNDEQRDAFRPITDFVHSQGAVAGIQLAHAGRKASTSRGWGPSAGAGTVGADQGGWQPVGPSPIAFPGLATPTELTAEGIAEVVRAFAASARRAVDAGFDLLELHGAHGYLLHEFLSPLSNERNDQYGGSLENRARALLETVDAVRAEVGEDVPLVVRLSATDWVEGGWDLPETEQVSAWLGEHGVDLVSVSTGGNVADAAIPVGPGYQLPFATAIRQATGVPVAAVGMIDDPFQAEQIVALGQADVVLVGRGALRDPNFPIRAAQALRVDLPYRPAPYERAYR
ncbi:NADH:flavin oxidoreductase/NADH oxidase [Curtobacterium aetherium]|uniref:NADH:flavin oxidoreductase/NADH oxidase n=1 Tax=Curtobacterium aetherium TaxID=2841594 RepID=A0ACD1E499_9MICO|nr:NADH:flavin oxidoreductase/NADH oxidase [Curtobacterium sp. L6-1]QWS33748.1 NADH:flavin oxidoreductase/NADH oxidase [Curtobacterium sp. L6-1]